MKQNHRFKRTLKVKKQLNENRLRNIAMLTSALYSARIEGNSLTFDDVKYMLDDINQENLLPKRKKILKVIKDHGTVSFDFLKRRFVQVPASTLHYDLKKLVEGNFIKKLGTTRGVCYSPKEK